MDCSPASHQWLGSLPAPPVNLIMNMQLLRENERMTGQMDGRLSESPLQ